MRQIGSVDLRKRTHMRLTSRFYASKTNRNGNSARCTRDVRRILSHVAIVRRDILSLIVSGKQQKIPILIMASSITTDHTGLDSQFRSIDYQRQMPNKTGQSIRSSRTVCYKNTLKELLFHPDL